MFCKYIINLVFIFLFSFSYASQAAISAAKNVSSVRVEGVSGMIHIYSESNAPWNTPGCTSAFIAIINPADIPHSEQLLTLVLSAKFAKSPIRFTAACTSNPDYIKVTDVTVE